MFQFDAYLQDSTDKEILNINETDYIDISGYKKISFKIEYFDKIEAVHQHIQECNDRINKLSQIEHLYLEMDLREYYINDQGQKELLLEFIVNTIIKKFAKTISFLSIGNTNLKFLLKEKSKQDEIETFLIKLLAPLQFLKTLQIEEKQHSKNLEEENLLMRIRKIIQSKQISFPHLTFIDIDSSFTFDHSETKQISQRLFDELIKTSDIFGALESIRNIQFSLQNLNLDSNFINRFSQSLSKCKNLHRLGLDFSHNQFIKTEDIILCINNLTSLSSSLKELVFIDTSVFTKKHADLILQSMKQFKCLTYLQIEGLVFKQGASEDFFKIFSFLDNLETLIVDFTCFDMKTLFQQNMKILGNSLNKLKTLDITFPDNLILKDQDMNSICQSLESLKQNLESLNITFSNKIGETSAILLIESICKLINLKELVLIFKLKGEVQNYININCSNNKAAKNIFECTNLNFNHKYYSDYLNLHLLLFLCVAKSQKYPIQEFKAIFVVKHFKLFSLQVIKDKIKEYFEVVSQQTTIKKIYWSFWEEFDYLNIQKMIFNNRNSIRALKAEIKDMDEIKDFFQYRNLEYLSLKMNGQSLDLDEVFKSFKDLQTLKYQNRGFYCHDEQINPGVILQSEYLTKVKFININVKYHNYNYFSDEDFLYQFISSRQAAINSIIAYQKLVVSQLQYQPDKSHLDIYF